MSSDRTRNDRMHSPRGCVRASSRSTARPAQFMVLLYAGHAEALHASTREVRPRRVTVLLEPPSGSAILLCEFFHMRGTALKIAVCIKRTPDSESRFRIGGSN